MKATPLKLNPPFPWSGTFQLLLKAFHRPKFARKKFSFTARLCRGSHANNGRRPGSIFRGWHGDGKEMGEGKIVLRILGPLSLICSFLLWRSWRLTRRERIRNAHLFIILFVRNFWESLFAIWLSVRNSVWGPLIEIQEEIHHFAVLGRGGLRGAKLWTKNLCTNRRFLKKHVCTLP